MFTRIYTGDDGQTHFEDLDLPADRAVHSGMQVTPGVNFRRFEAGYFSDWHTAPRRQYVITLQGRDGGRHWGRHQTDLWTRGRATGRRPDWAGPHYRRRRKPTTGLGNHTPDAVVALAPG